MDTIRILVVDDHTLFRKGVIEVLQKQEGFVVAGEANNGLDAVLKAKEVDPDVVLMDLNMPRCTGLEATKMLQTVLPQAKVLILTVSEEESDLFSAIRSGARGYILKNVEPEDLVQNIIHISQGGVILSPTFATMLLEQIKTMGDQANTQPAEVAKDDALSPREQEVLQLVAHGDTNKQIADSLMISENTVKTHLRSIMEKLHLANRGQAAAYAFKNRPQQ